MAEPSTITVPAQTFTAAQLLALVEYRIAAILAGTQSYSENGRNITHVVFKDLCEQREKLKSEVQDAVEGENGGGIVLVQFGQPQ